MSRGIELDCPYITADRRLYDRARTLPPRPPPLSRRLPPVTVAGRRASTIGTSRQP